MVILWEAQVSPLGLHSKRWLAHRNEFLPETKTKVIQKFKIVRQCVTSYSGVPKIRIRPTASAIEDGVRGTRLRFHFSIGFPSPQQPMLSMFSSTFSPNHSTLCLNIDRHGYWRGWKNEGARAQKQPARL